MGASDREGVSFRRPAEWSVAHPTANTWVVLNVRADQQETARASVRVQIGYQKRTSHADAMSQLVDIANEYATPASFLTIGGWPALQRSQVIRRPQPSQAPRDPDLMMVQITTAIAAGDTVIRLEGRLPSDASQQLKDEVTNMGQSLSFSSAGNASEVEQEVNRLKALPARPEPPRGSTVLSAPRAASLVPSASRVRGRAQNLNGSTGSSPILTLQQVPFGTNGELEITVSNDGANIVMGKQSCWLTSNDGGQTFPSSGCLPVGDGDSSLAFGQSGTFYHAALGCFGTSCAAVCPANSNCAEIAPSTTNGQTFGALVNAVVCPNSGSGACNIDQEHIAADRTNAATGGNDLVYMAFRQCLGGCGGESDIACSSDSGATWTPRLALESNADFPRVTVGQDGFFYVVYRVGGNVRIDKYNSCSNPMTQVSGFPKTVSSFNDVFGCEAANGFPGLDRCNDGNILSSPTVGVDDTNANHVYVAWSTNTAHSNPGLGNENVLVSDSTDAGATWRAPVTINAGVTGRRFMPWVCTTGGNAFATYYDRRAATAANNDLTDYFAASAGLSSGNLVANNDEFQISTTTDAQCTTWPAGPRTTFDAENCSVQPQNAGTCSVSKTRCDFAGGDGLQCPMGETCQTGNGAVKYGDYNGNACILGRLYTVFSSSAGQTTTGAPLNFFQSFVVSPTTTLSVYTGDTAGDYHDTVTLSGVLTLSGTSIGIAGQTLTLAVGAQSCTAVTGSSGSASCTLTLNQVPGAYTATVSFAGNGNYEASTSAGTSFTITKEETTLSYTGDTVIANGTTAHLSGVLLEDGLTPIAGRTVVFTLGTGATQQTCSGTTNALGAAACTVIANQPLGAGNVADSFAGDAFYKPSSASASTILFAFLSQGAFVLGNQTAVVGSGTVEFWGFDWSMQNVLSGGSAPDAFKGFAGTTTTPPACGGTWTSRPGNSSDPPPGPLPSFMGVVVSDTITKSGSAISGDVLRIVVVATNPGYAPDPGHPGTSSVVTVYCK